MAETTRDAVTVVHAPRETPYGAIVLAAIAKRFSKANESPIAFEAGKAIEPGTYLLEKAKLQEPQLLRELCLRIPSCKRMLYIDSSASLDQWINYVTLHSATPKTPVADLWQYYNKMNTHLATRTFLIGYRMTVVDVLQFAALSNAKAVCKELAKVPHVQRWYNYIIAIPGVQQAVSDIQRKNVPQVEKKPFTKEQQIDNSYKGAVTGCTKRTEYADALKNAEQGKVVVRFAPEPSGYLHIGHTKAALLNDYFAKQYNGKLLLRFDDTNPVKEKLEYEETIKEDLQTLGVAFSSTSYTSDYFELMQDYAFKLIKSDLAYCDDTDVNTMRHQRTEGIESACRNLSVETNIANFEEMLKGSEKGMTYCLRAKIDMTHTNKCLRDPVIYRCIADAHHNRQGDKYKAFPTYDFACPIVDSIEGVTHALRSNEYSARIPQYNWFIEKCQLRPVEIYEFSRLNFVKTILSKRKLQWFVDNGVVNGWDDPRMPTVRGIMRKGLTLKALLEFILELGPSKAVNLMEWDKLWAKNKQVIDPIVPRFAAVGVDAVELKLDNFNDVTLPPAKRNLHPKDPSMGECDLWFAPTVLLDRVDADEIADGEEITLMRWGNAIVSTPSLHAQLNPDGDFRKTKKKLHWLPKDDDKLVKCTLKQYGDILAVDKIDPEQLAEPDDMRNFLEPVTEWSTPCLADRQLAALPRGSIVQLERRGYYIVDQIAAEGGLILISIPDGKMKKST
ncbi:glutamyl-tRNA synthetase family protein, putative [Babesia bigemina]|uniref:glutamate--tRNA ligase n=1 Tax=Babesia bigemina TaxID=5866 RepID=A0A061DE31_BABBI|nr:glutamyl-tRNA synthetase family protein, putative [Babesia bigemina]CDR97924.1 glutamyl-tRNA synthetase family protein, putative [Babesia bigemina]|eukprot:XP_012770110.1 glutamyl-tRNA synthetase family protein, putative [Babesia bigemina]